MNDTTVFAPPHRSLAARTPRRPASHGRRRGATLIELVLVVSIMGTLSMIAFPRLSAMQQRLRLDEAAQQFARRLNGAHIEALKRNRSVTVKLQGSQKYVVDGRETYALPKGIKFGTGPTEVTYASFGPPTAGVGSIELKSDSRTRVVRVLASGFASVK